MRKLRLGEATLTGWHLNPVGALSVQRKHVESHMPVQTHTRAHAHTCTPDPAVSTLQPFRVRRWGAGSQGRQKERGEAFLQEKEGSREMGEVGWPPPAWVSVTLGGGGVSGLPHQTGNPPSVGPASSIRPGRLAGPPSPATVGSSRQAWAQPGGGPAHVAFLTWASASPTPECCGTSPPLAACVHRPLAIAPTPDAISLHIPH